MLMVRLGVIDDGANFVGNSIDIVLCSFRMGDLANAQSCSKREGSVDYGWSRAVASVIP
jgi:hypothetical protein